MTPPTLSGDLWQNDVDELRRLRAEREKLRELAKAVRDYWRANAGLKGNGIMSTPGMVLLMAVEKP